MFIGSLLLACALSSTPAPAPPTVEAGTREVPETEEHLLATLRAQPLTYTRHARCRMGCRDVTEAEVQGLLQNGRWNAKRSREDERCPSHAFEGEGDGGQRLRVVFAACPDETRVITAIDLGQDWPCDCD